MRATTVLAVVLCAVSFLLTACSPPYRKAFDDEAQTQHWNKKQELAAFAYADRIYWAHETSEGSGQYVFLYSRVPTSKVASQLATVLADFDAIQDPKAEEWVKFGQAYGLKQDFDHEEEVEKVIYARVHAADLENEFKVELGQESPDGPDVDLQNGYNIKRIYLNKPLAEAFPFKSDEIEGAKAAGTLKEIEHAELDLSSQLDHKDVNPSNPTDGNDFVWKPKSMSIRLTNFKIMDKDKPVDNQGNYIEGFRVVDGKQEPYPCLKVFFPSNGMAAIVLLDTAREGEPGYGVPDVLQRIYTLKNVQDVIRNGTILSELFSEKKKDKREIPEAKVFKVEISRLDTPVDMWEASTADSGWMVPFKYRNDLDDNYNIRIKFKKLDVDPNDPQAIIAAHSGYMDIEYIAKEYTKTGDRYEPSAGQVIEYYRPAPGFSVHVKAHVLEDEDTKKVEFELSDGTVTDGFITTGKNKFIEDTPCAVAYTEGSKRYWIEKNGSKIYSRRKQVSPPREATGTYSDDSDVLSYGARPEVSGPTEGKRPK